MKAAPNRPLTLYQAKRSSVLVLCFTLLMLHSAQFHIFEGMMYELVQDEVGIEHMKYSSHLVEMATYFGFLLSPLLTGMFIVKTSNAKTAAIFGSLIASASTFLFPATSNSLFNAMWVRGLLGTGVGMNTIAISAFIIYWIPKQEITRAVCLFASANFAGVMIASLWAKVIATTYSWQATFYWFATVPLIFLPLWCYVVVKSPLDHSKITSSELNFLRSNVSPAEGFPLLLKKLFQSKQVWVLVVCLTLLQFVQTSLIATMPYYLVDVFWVDTTFGFLTGLLLCANLIAMVFDYLLQKERLEQNKSNPRRLREVVGFCGMLGCALFLKFFCGPMHSMFVRVIAYTVALLFYLAAHAGPASAVFEVAPRHAPILLGCSFTFATLLNIAGHIGFRWVLDSTGNWSFVLSGMSLALFISGVLWGVFGSTDKIIG